MKLPQMPADKANHALYGAAVSLVTQTAVATAGMFGLDLHGLRPKDLGLAASAAFGVGKELVDYAVARVQAARGKPVTHAAEKFDALATFSGGGAIWLAQA